MKNAAIVIAALLPLFGCAGGGTPAQRLPADWVAVDVPELGLPSPVAGFSEIEDELGDGYWSDLVSYTAPETESPFGRGICGLIDRPPVKVGAWRLVGASKPIAYVPILDVYADRRGLQSRNELTYYYFELRGSAE